MEGIGRLQFSDPFIELPVLPEADGVVGTFKCVLLYILLSPTVSVWTLSMPYYIYKVSFLCVHFHSFFCKHILHTRYVSFDGFF